MPRRPHAVLVIENRSWRPEPKGLILTPVPEWAPWDAYSTRYPATQIWWIRLYGVTVMFGRTQRMPAPAVCIPDGCVSRRHCQVVSQADGYAVQDLGSSGGIGLCETNRANAGTPVQLVSGDYFFVGGYVDRRVVYFDDRGPQLPAWASPLISRTF